MELFDGVDSLDSVRLAERLNEAAGKLGKRLPVLIEVKLSPEDTKAGVDLSRTRRRNCWSACLTSRTWNARADDDRAVGCCGRRDASVLPQLATVAGPLGGGASAAGLEVLSMGMSGDFPIAIEEGATRIRIGTALFGPRSSR